MRGAVSYLKTGNARVLCCQWELERAGGCERFVGKTFEFQ